MFFRFVLIPLFLGHGSGQVASDATLELRALGTCPSLFLGLARVTIGLRLPLLLLPPRLLQFVISGFVVDLQKGWVGRSGLVTHLSLLSTTMEVGTKEEQEHLMASSFPLW